MDAYAVIETGGKQYKVQQGDVLDIELLVTDEGSSLEFDALAISDGKDLTIGTPIVEGAKVSAVVLDDHLRGKKYSLSRKNAEKDIEEKSVIVRN